MRARYLRSQPSNPPPLSLLHTWSHHIPLFYNILSQYQLMQYIITKINISYFWLNKQEIYFICFFTIKCWSENCHVQLLLSIISIDWIFCTFYFLCSDMSRATGGSDSTAGHDPSTLAFWLLRNPPTTPTPRYSIITIYSPIRLDGYHRTCLNTTVLTDSQVTFSQPNTFGAVMLVAVNYWRIFLYI